MATLHLKSLDCKETEDNTGSDECELRVWADSAYYTFRRDMNNGETWPMDIMLRFNSRVKIQLYDLDNPGFPTYDDHDWLGTAIIRPQTTDNGEAAFDKDGADYTLYYEVK